MVNKFNGIHSKLVDMNQSGKTDEDIIDEATQDEAYSTKPFKHLECWKILQDQRQFQQRRHEAQTIQDADLFKPSEHRLIGKQTSIRQRHSDDQAKELLHSIQEDASNRTNLLVEMNGHILAHLSTSRSEHSAQKDELDWVNTQIKTLEDLIEKQSKLEEDLEEPSDYMLLLTSKLKTRRVKQLELLD